MFPLGLHQNGQSRFRILCFGAHCDDIETGCGATLLKLKQELGNRMEIHWVVLSGTPEREREAIRSARRFLKGVKTKTVSIHHFADSYFPYDGVKIKDCIRDLGRSLSPDLIFTHQRDDLHQDHRLVSELTWNVFRDHWILEYEIPKYDGDMGAPNVFVQLSPSLCRRKIQTILESFPTQRGKPWFTEDTFWALLRLRGVESNAPSRYAEAFYCRKMLLV
ncbi:MAG TPA: PIG-L deacetylase family protein [Verrucomicrobiae bacterium]|nr:PIG-L deacetylase family protein [Verrucomicrobiae bacterium]